MAIAHSDLEAAYEGVESLDHFTSSAELDAYRSMILEKSRQQADFIRELIPKGASIIEACCGNGRLLVALAPYISSGKGFDISESRVEFAKAWLSNLALPHIEVWRDDVIEPGDTLRSISADLAVCITGAFSYFGALSDDADTRALSVLADQLNKGGSLLLELYQHSSVLAHCAVEPDGLYRRWHELPERDPYRFSLSEFHFDKNAKILNHRKTFIGRDGEVDEGRREALRIYTPGEIEALFSDRFSTIELFSGWTGEPYREGAAQMLVWARK